MTGRPHARRVRPEADRMESTQTTPVAIVATDDPARDAASADLRLTVVPNRGGDGLGISVKVEGTGRLFRIEPARDPNAPRFWCLRVYRCGVVRESADAASRWLGAGGMNRADLPAAVAAIRDDPTAWLARGAGPDLREWMLGDDPPRD
jgi:hypothetical protein